MSMANTSFRILNLKAYRYLGVIFRNQAVLLQVLLYSKILLQWINIVAHMYQGEEISSFSIGVHDH